MEMFPPHMFIESFLNSVIFKNEYKGLRFFSGNHELISPHLFFSPQMSPELHPATVAHAVVPSVPADIHPA